MRIRDSKGRFVGRKVMDERVETLRRVHGFNVGYAWREDATRFGYLGSSQVTGEYYGGYRTNTITGEGSEFYGEPYVSLDGIACGDDSYGDRSSVDRSNYRSLRRDFPDFPWVDTSYTNVDVLGCFVADLDDDMAGLLIGLSEQYPVYDEGDMSELEHGEINASWDEWMAYELRRELSEPCQAMWDALGGDTVSEIVWGCVSSDVFGCYPEHRGVEVAWGDIKERAADLRPFLVAAYVSQVRQGSILPAAWEWIPAVQKFINEKGN